MALCCAVDFRAGEGGLLCEEVARGRMAWLPAPAYGIDGIEAWAHGVGLCVGFGAKTLLHAYYVD